MHVLDHTHNDRLPFIHLKIEINVQLKWMPSRWAKCERLPLVRFQNRGQIRFRFLKWKWFVEPEISDVRRSCHRIIVGILYWSEIKCRKLKQFHCKRSNKANEISYIHFIIILIFYRRALAAMLTTRRTNGFELWKKAQVKEKRHTHCRTEQLQHA